MMNNKKPLHYWNLHKKVCKRQWDEMSHRTKIAIANNNDSFEARTFAKMVADEANELFNDPAYYENDPYSFRYAEAV